MDMDEYFRAWNLGFSDSECTQMAEEKWEENQLETSAMEEHYRKQEDMKNIEHNLQPTDAGSLDPVVLRIGQLAIAAHQLSERAVAHSEDAEGCGYANDPTGIGHVNDSRKRANDAAEKLALEIDKYMSQKNLHQTS